MNSIKIAFRNLNRQKKRSFLLGGAIAFGIMIITLLNGFTGSFITNVGENFSHLLAGHIFLSGYEKSETGKSLSVIRDDSVILNTLDNSDLPITYLTKRSSFQGMLIFEGESISQAITGADFAEESYLTERLFLLEGDISDLVTTQNGVIISEEVSKKLNVLLGERLLVQLRTVTGQQNVGEFIIVGISHDPGIFGSISAYANIEYVNELLNLSSGEYMTLGIFVEDIKTIDMHGESLYSSLSDKVNLFKRSEPTESGNPMMAMMQSLKDESWEGIRYQFYTLNDVLAEVQQIVRVLNIVGLVILLIVFVIIMVGITNTFRMVMFERIREIGTMRALGMQRGSVRKLFILEALFLSLGGALSGFIIAGIIMFILSKINIGMDTPLFILLKNGHLSFNPAPLQIVSNVLIVALLTTLAAFFPARKASMLQPADALRAQK
jgi:putative ABC transport system permease protein